MPKYQITDQPVAVRESQQLPQENLQAYLHKVLGSQANIMEIKQFPSGFSNLTYLIKTKSGEYVLRKPPAGVNIKSAHDMSREYKVLSLLKPHYPQVPAPLAYAEDESIIGTPFYLMDRVTGVILRNKAPEGTNLAGALMAGISESAVRQLAELHDTDLESSGLIELGKPDGYTKRQVTGWQKRYLNSKTDEISELEKSFEWLTGNYPPETGTAFLHNDFKYDNLVLDPADLTRVKSILDWEMSTVGDPLMDLGTTLAYWSEATDPDALKPFNLTWLPGNLNREEVVEKYFSYRKQPVPDMVFYYVFGTLKVATICQQIYARFKQGKTDDPRFGKLIFVTRACAENASRAIKHNRISNLY